MKYATDQSWAKAQVEKKQHMLMYDQNVRSEFTEEDKIDGKNNEKKQKRLQGNSSNSSSSSSSSSSASNRNYSYPKKGDVVSVLWVDGSLQSGVLVDVKADGPIVTWNSPSTSMRKTQMYVMDKMFSLREHGTKWCYGEVDDIEKILDVRRKQNQRLTNARIVKRKYLRKYLVVNNRNPPEFYKREQRQTPTFVALKGKEKENGLRAGYAKLSKEEKQKYVDLAQLDKKGMPMKKRSKN